MPALPKDRRAEFLRWVARAFVLECSRSKFIHTECRNSTPYRLCNGWDGRLI
jgi:hypothetical protein